MRCRYIATLLFLQLLQVCDCVEWQHCLYFIPEDVIHEAGSAITTNPKSAVLKKKKKSRLPLSKWIEKKTPSWTRRTRRQTVQTASVDVATDASSPDTPGPCVKKNLKSQIGDQDGILFIPVATHPMTPPGFLTGAAEARGPLNRVT